MNEGPSAIVIFVAFLGILIGFGLVYLSAQTQRGEITGHVYYEN